MADDSVVLLDDSGSEEDIPRPPACLPSAGVKRSRAEYLKLLSEAKDDTYESKKPVHPGIGASLEEMRKYQEDLYLYQEEVTVNRQCEHLQFSTLLQEQDERAKRAVQERNLEVAGVIGDFAPFHLCRFLYAAPLADFIVWSDAQARIQGSSDEISIALTRPSSASKWGFEFAVPQGSQWLEVKSVVAVTYARVQDSVHAKLALHLPALTYPAFESAATSNAFAVMSNAATGKAKAACSKGKDTMFSTVSKLRIGDEIIGVDHLDLRNSSPVQEGVATPVAKAVEILHGHSTHLLLRVRRPRGVMSREDRYAIRPAWSFPVDKNLLRQQIVRLLAQEKLAMKWPKHAQQYLDKMQQRIETGIASASCTSDSVPVAAEACRMDVANKAGAPMEHPIVLLLRTEVSKLQDGLSRLPSRPASGAVPGT
jgi:hypothetical protein